MSDNTTFGAVFADLLYCLERGEDITPRLRECAEEWADVPLRLATPAAVPAQPVTMPQPVADGHTGKRVLYRYEDERWEGWLVTLTSHHAGTQATVKRDNGEDWVVLARNCTPIDAPTVDPVES